MDCPIAEQRLLYGRYHQAQPRVILFVATLPCDILSGFLVFCDRVVYPTYFSSARGIGFSALEDEQVGRLRRLQLLLI
jgi:hypothetical protein